MPPMIATLDISRKQDLEQEFELDIRISPATALLVFDPAATGGQCGPTHASCPTPCPSCHSCNTCNCSDSCMCSLGCFTTGTCFCN